MRVYIYIYMKYWQSKVILLIFPICTSTSSHKTKIWASKNHDNEHHFTKNGDWKLIKYKKGNINVKLLFTTTCFVCFYSVQNLIVIIFNLLYPVCIVGFHCKGCVIERVVWRLKHLKTEEDFAGISRLSIPQSISCTLHVLECEESG